MVREAHAGLEAGRPLPHWVGLTLEIESPTSDSLSATVSFQEAWISSPNAQYLGRNNFEEERFIL